MVVDRVKQSPPLSVFLPVWSSNGGCLCVVSRESTPVQLAHTSCFFKEFSALIIKYPPFPPAPCFFFLSVWSSSGGCNFVVYRERTPVQLAHTFFFVLSESSALIVEPPPPYPLFFFLPVW